MNCMMRNDDDDDDFESWIPFSYIYEVSNNGIAQVHVRQN